MSTALLLGLVCAALALGLYLVWKQGKQHAGARDDARRERDAARAHLVALEDRFRPVVDADAEGKRIVDEATAERAHIMQALNDARDQLTRSIEALTKQQELQQGEHRALETRITDLQAEFAVLDEQANLQSFGFYKPRFDFVTSAEYQQKLEHARTAQKNLITAGTAATCSIEWTVNGSVAEGRKNTAQYLKLIVRAFNGECDAATARVKFNNVGVMEARIRKSFEAINKISKPQHSSLSETYLDLRLRELYLIHEVQEKLQEEKEVQRQVREQMREEELAQRELEKARIDAEKEEKRYAEALRKAELEVAQATGEKQLKLLAQIAQLQQQLAQAQHVKQRALSQAQLTRSGHVYVISNIGSFGEDVYKIGMTRRLEPLERVKELGDASVPFQFDVHAVIYCDDAPKLENTLHRLFHHRRLNRINERKEFFRVSLTEIAQAVHANHGAIDFLHEAEAQEYRKTMALLSEAEAV